MRNIQSIKVQHSKYSTTIYVNFDNGTFGTRNFENGQWMTNNLNSDELRTAKTLAVVNGKWQNWTAPRKVSSFAPRSNDEGDTINDIEAMLNFKSQGGYFLSTEEELGKSGL